MINTIVVEDNLYMQKHLENMLSTEPDFRIVGSFQDAFEAERACMNSTVDLVLMDVQTLHNHSGLAAGKRIKAAGGKAKIVIVTSLVDPELLEQAKNSGIDSLWYKDHGDAGIMEAIRSTLAGERVFPDCAPSVELGNIHTAELTPRQMETLRYFVIGLTNSEIAAKMNLSTDGVRWNLKQIVQKCGFENKHELLTAAIDNKLVVTLLKEEKI